MAGNSGIREKINASLLRRGIGLDRQIYDSSCRYYDLTVSARLPATVVSLLVAHRPSSIRRWPLESACAMKIEIKIIER